MTTSDFQIHELIETRWSPRQFSSKPIGNAELGSILSAAQRAPSCFNEQPWSFIVGAKGEGSYDMIFDALAEGNKTWANTAPILLVSVAKMNFDHNGKPNRHAWHDVGLAVENAIVQARALGFQAHQMAGFDPAKVTESFGIPSDWQPVAVIAMGRDDTPAEDKSLKPRKALSDFVFSGRWGQSRKPY